MEEGKISVPKRVRFSDQNTIIIIEPEDRVNWMEIDRLKFKRRIELFEELFKRGNKEK